MDEQDIIEYITNPQEICATMNEQCKEDCEHEIEQRNKAQRLALIEIIHASEFRCAEELADCLIESKWLADYVANSV